MINYKFNIFGYGGESVFAVLTKEQYEYWQNAIDQDGTDVLLDYLLDTGESMENAKLDFTLDEDGNRCEWYELPTELEHINGANYYESKIVVSKLEDDDIENDGEEILNEDISDFCEQISEESEVTIWEPRVHEMDGNYIVEIRSVEKGTFVECLLREHHESSFNPVKLRVYTTEYPDEVDVIDCIEYDEEELDIMTSSTNGKGYDVVLHDLT